MEIIGILAACCAIDVLLLIWLLLVDRDIKQINQKIDNHLYEDKRNKFSERLNAARFKGE